MKDRGWNRQNQEYMDQEFCRLIAVLCNHSYYPCISSIWKCFKIFNPFNDVKAKDIKSLLKEYNFYFYAVIQEKFPHGEFQHEVVSVYVAKDKTEQIYYKMNGIENNY